jgi:hypothetical protein
MQRAYILMETEVGQSVDVARRAARQRGVLQVELVTGPFDVVALAEAPSIAELHDGPFTRIDADLRVTRAVLCPVGHVVVGWQPEPLEPEPLEPEPLPIPEPEPVLIGIDPEGPSGL